MQLTKKAIFRLYRIITGKKGIYGKIKKHNQFTKGVFITEGAKIGSYNYFGPYTMVNNAIVGNYCSIAPNVKIGQANHSISYITTCQKISAELINHSLYKESAIIGNDVWCGANVVVMQGVRIGNGAVVGANAVVTKDIPDYGVAIGIPAKVIRYRFDPEIIKKISESRWFEYDLVEAKKIIELLAKELIINFKKEE